MGRQPDFIVVGAQKGGSTQLVRCLRGHPDIVMKSIPRHVLQHDDFGRWHIEQIHALSEGVEKGQILGCVRICFGDDRIPSRLYRAVPDTRIVISIRDPIARAVSSWYQHMEAARVPVMPAEQGLRALLEDRIDRERYPLAEEVLSIGRYEKHLSTYLECFPRQRLYVMTSDEAWTQPRNSLRRLCEFLGRDPEHMPSELPKKRNPGHYSMTHQRLTRWFLPLYMKRSLGDQFPTPRQGPLARVARIFFKNILDNRIFVSLFPSRAPVLSNDLRGRLASYYRDDLIALESLLGRTLEQWPTMQLVRSMDAAAQSEHTAERAAADAGS